MTDQAPQRVWRANCSFCGAPVDFKSAASPMAVCSYCKSTLVRDGETLRRIGQSAALFDDHSPLALGARGRHRGEPFTLVGRVQMAHGTSAEQLAAEPGRWTEWHALFDNGQSAWLSEDNGAYVLSLPQSADHALPDLKGLLPGDPLVVAQQAWVVGSVMVARVLAAQGELAFKPDFKNVFRLIELRNPQDQVLSIDTSEQPPRCFVGSPVTIEGLAMTGLNDADQPAQAGVEGQGLSCPSCGSALTPQLSTTKSIVCSSCHAVVDISQGLGGALAHYQQSTGDEPLIPLGRTGKIQVDGQVGPWQVVGYQERCDLPSPGDDEETTFWREYLLYHRTRGFAFLVDAEDGWSVVRPATGVPSVLGRGKVSFRGVSYREQATYQAKSTYVLGEFYWPVKRDQRVLVSDHVGIGADSQRRLSKEEVAGEITWSVGQTLSADAVMKAFDLASEPQARFVRDAKPMSGQIGIPSWLVQVLFWAVVLLLPVMIDRCSDECDGVKDSYGASSFEYRQCRANAGSGYTGSHGGSYGGYNSGGFHK